VSCEDAGWHGAQPQLARTEEARGSNPLTSTPNLAGQSVASVERATLTAGSGRAAAARSSHRAAQRLSEASRPSPRPRTMITQRGHCRLPRRRSSCASSLSRSATRSTWPIAHHLPRRRPSPSRPSAGPARPAPASNARLQPRAEDALSWTRRATTPTPGHPSHAAAGLHHARDLIPIGHSGRRNPRTPDAGRWRPDSGHLDAQTPAPDTGRVDRHVWTLDARIGHWTPAARHQRGHGDNRTAGIRTSLATTPSDRALGRPRCSCGRRLQRSAARAGSA
jgi:hypothetical protein